MNIQHRFIHIHARKDLKPMDVVYFNNSLYLVDEVTPTLKNVILADNSLRASKLRTTAKKLIAADACKLQFFYVDEAGREFITPHRAFFSAGLGLTELQYIVSVKKNGEIEHIRLTNEINQL